MGQADFYSDGDWNAECFRCGRKFKASMMRKNWQGFWTCPADWEPRHPQDFVKSVPDEMTPPWTQPRTGEVFTEVCTPEAVQAIPGLGLPGCMMPGRNDHLIPGFYSFCLITGRLSIAGFAQAGCWLAGVYS